MKGLYILAGIVAVVAILGYLAIKPTDSDLQRAYGKLVDAMDGLEQRIAELQEPLVFLRKEKRRTAKLDKEFELRRQKASALRLQLNAARYNIENLRADTRQATEDVLHELDREMMKQLSGAVSFGAKVNALYECVRDGFPLLRQMETLQQRLNQLVEKQKTTVAPWPETAMSDVEHYLFQCEQHQNWIKQALTTIHTDLEQGQVLARTAINELRKLLPNLEAFVEDLEKGINQPDRD